MITLTKEWLQQTIAELEEERDATPGAVNEDAANALAAMKLALASLEAEAMTQVLSSRAGNDTSTIDKALPEGTMLYTAPPAPVVPEKLPCPVMLEPGLRFGKGVRTQTMLDALQRRAEYSAELEAMTPEQRTDHDAGMKEFAAMLQGAEKTEPLHAVKDATALDSSSRIAESLHADFQGAEPVTTANKLPEETSSSLQLRNLIRQRHAEWSQATFGDVGPVGPLKHLSKEALEAAEEPDDLSEWADMQFLLWDAQRRAGISDGEITAALEEKLKVNMARQWPEPRDGEPRLHIKAGPQQGVK